VTRELKADFVTVTESKQDSPERVVNREEERGAWRVLG
jgi:hypothetical protein